MFDEALFIIAVYCVIDDLYRQLYPGSVRHRGFAPQLSDVEALTIVIVGEYLGLGDDKAIFEYFYKHHRDWFPALSDRTLLVRQRANLWQVEQAIWQALVRRNGVVPIARPSRSSTLCPFPFVRSSATSGDVSSVTTCSSSPKWATAPAKIGTTLASRAVCASPPMA